MDKLRKGWDMKLLGEIATISSGGTPNRKNETYWKGSIPWVTTAEVKFNTIFDTSEKITEDGLNNSSAKLFPVNTILMAMYGQGKTRGQVAKLGIDATTNQACAAIMLNDGYFVDFYYQYLMSKYDDIREMSNSGGQENLSAGIIKKIKVPVPPLPEQIKIAEILSTWDNAIQTTEKQLANSQQQKKVLMQMLLSGEKRVAGFSGEWGNAKLGNVAKMSSGGTPKSTIKEYYNGDIKWVSIADMTKQGKYILETEKTLSQLGLENSSAKLFPENTILYAMYASIGECSIAKVPVTSSQAILGIQPSEVLYFEYLYFYLCSLKDRIKLQGQQGTQANLNAGMVKDFDILLPTIDEQQKIAEILTTADQEIETLQRKLECLKLEKRALMQGLL